MSQVQVCSYCHLMQRAKIVEHLEPSAEDLQRYLDHLWVEHGVILEPEIPR